ncbi:alanine racemase [Williamsia serinedens]|uniref:D-serine deaminase, pyridoxal phosphate-dependent n=1 Tax=Williamsia serinedens TaxID=391736 RepID=A0ABT1H443_9NOCA|nr:alanine racemase [Williamsia serinedens]MCP2161517.1 D-serine deaminase, pyridoxal phosphate-dependent [Williamsia serinedens]
MTVTLQRSRSAYDVDWSAIGRAVHHLDGPVVALDRAAFEANVADLRRRAGGVPIRVASKSLRVRSVIDDILARDGFAGVLAYDLDEAIWLATTSGITDVLVGYPSARRGSIAALAADEVAAGRVTMLVDSVDHLDLIDAAVPAGSRPPLRVAIDLDASLDAPVVGHIGVRRSPVHSLDDALSLARAIVARPGLRLVGVMSYEAQVAGVGDDVDGGWQTSVRNTMIRGMQRVSMAELRRRRGTIIGALRELADLEFVNAGGTGSLEATATDSSVTDIAAGSGFFGGHLFDTYAHFRPAPAVGFGLQVVRRPGRGVVTCHGGGWIASGPPAADRLPLPVWPPGLRYEPREAAGEVQTPLIGDAADSLAVGDRVWFRHTKSGEVAEHTPEIVIVGDGTVVDTVPTYRGEGKCFL